MQRKQSAGCPAQDVPPGCQVRRSDLKIEFRPGPVATRRPLAMRHRYRRTVAFEPVICTSPCSLVRFALHLQCLQLIAVADCLLVYGQSTGIMSGLNMTQTTYATYDSSHLRAAGVRGGRCNAAPESATAALTWAERPATPAALKKYRQSTLHTPGQIFRHFGAADDPVDLQRTYGKVRG